MRGVWITFAALLSAGCLEAGADGNGTDPADPMEAPALPYAPVRYDERSSMAPSGVPERTWTWTIGPDATVARVYVALEAAADQVQSGGFCIIVWRATTHGSGGVQECSDGQVVIVGNGARVYLDEARAAPGEYRVSFSADPGVGTFVLDVDVQY